MLLRYTSLLVLLLGFCPFVFCVMTEEEQKHWFDDLEKSHWDNCKDTISADSLQQLRDDMEADNEEIRDFRLCLSAHHGYINMSEISTSTIMDDYVKYTAETNDDELKLAAKILNICRDEGKSERTDKDIVGKFIMCVIDRCKSEQ